MYVRIESIIFDLDQDLDDRQRRGDIKWIDVGRWGQFFHAVGLKT